MTDPGKGDDRRRRFVAFAFALADLLIEIDGEFVIRFAEGSVAGLGFKGLERAEALIGKDIRRMFVKNDRALFEESVRTMNRKGRLEPISFGLASNLKRPTPVVVGGFFLPTADDPLYHLAIIQNNRLYCQETPNLKRDETTGLLESKTFADKVKDRAIISNLSETDYEMGMLVVAGLKNLKQNADPGKVEDFMHRLGAMLRSWSLGGDTAGAVAEERFSFVGEEGLDQSKIDAINEEARAILGDDASYVSIQSVTATLDTAELSDEDASKALIHCLNKFANENPGSFNIKSLSQGVTDYLDSTVDRVQQLRSIIEARNFHLAFQPIVDLKTRMVDHYEVLSRFESLMTPLELIQFAESVGMIHDLDLVIVHQVLHTLEKRLEEDSWRPSVAINLSAKSIQNDLFLRSLRQLTQHQSYTRFIPQVIFEVTETAMIEDLDLLNKAIQRLREDGHAVSIDDVGSGNTSFTLLNRVNADHAKIDGSLVRGFLQDNRTRNILRSVIEACHSMDFDVICEHIEHEDEARELMVMGARFGQGYLFGKPTADGKQPGAIRYDPRSGRPTLAWG